MDCRKKNKYDPHMKIIRALFLVVVAALFNLMIFAEDYVSYQIDGRKVNVPVRYSLHQQKNVDSSQISPLPEKVQRYLFGSLRPRKGVEFFLEHQVIMARENNTFYTFYSSGKIGAYDARTSIVHFIEHVENETQAKELANFIFGNGCAHDQIITSKAFYDKYIEEVAKYDPNLILEKGKDYLDFDAKPYKNVGFIVSMSRMVNNNLKITKVLFTRNGGVGILEDIVVVKDIERLRNAMLVHPEESKFDDLYTRVYKYAEEQEKTNKSGRDIFYSNCPYPVTTPADEDRESKALESMVP